jgi:hypothetical protein
MKLLSQEMRTSVVLHLQEEKKEEVGNRTVFIS